MTKEWVNPEIVSLDVQQTSYSNQPDKDPDGVYGAIFPGGYGRECDTCPES